MQNYKALKSVNKVSAAKVKVVDREAIEASDETYYTKDNVIDWDLKGLAKDIESIKKDITGLQSYLADLEQLEKDLKAL